MAYNGSGTFNLYTPGNPVVTGTTISSTWANNTLNDVATGLSTAITKDGQTTTTAPIPFATAVVLSGGITGAATASGAVSSTAGGGFMASNNTGSLAQNATFDTTTPNSGVSGIIIVRNETTNEWAVFGFSTDLSATVLISKTLGSAFSISQGTATSINVYINANKVRIENTFAAARVVGYGFLAIA